MTRKEWEPIRLNRIEEYEKMTVQERRKAFLDDTIAHYNIRNRAIEPYTNSCLYRPTSVSCGCAIGRWLTVEVAEKLPKACVNDDGIPDQLPKWMVDMGLKFLLDVQNLHDSGYCWDENGLTGLGAKEAASIRRRFKLN